MKRFSDVNTKIKIEIEDREGDVQEFELQHISPKIMKQLQQRTKEIKDSPDVAIDVGMEQMALFFGGVPDDYEKYSIATITQVIKYIWEQISGGKSLAEQEKK